MKKIEKQNIEFKREWQDSFLRVICAFANTDGGELFVGINDKGNVLGVKDAKKLLEILPNIIRNKLGIIPDIVLQKRKEKMMLKIIVKPSSVPISFSGRYYVRSGSVNLELRGNELSNFLLHRIGQTWDEIIEDRANLDDIDAETMTQFKKFSLDRLPFIDKEKNIKTILDKLNLTKGKKIKRAALILFGKDTQKYYPQAYLKIGKFSSESDVVSSDVITGNLFQQIDAAMNILRTKYLISSISYEDIHRREILEYPHDALREAILNALIHRDYTGSAAVQVRVYDDKLIIMNEGKLPKEVPVEKLKQKHISKPRNVLLADVFYKAGFIESWGRGTLKIVDDCLKQKLPEPEFNEESGVFSVVFFKARERVGERVGKKVGERVGKKVGVRPGEKLTDNQRKILELIKQDAYISAVKIAKAIKLSIRKTEENIKKLRERKCLKRIGPARGGYWEVVRD
jgi:ATP-dependent DNA helicase RecG